MIDDDGRHAEADCLLNLLALFRRILTAFIDAQVPSAAPDVLTGIRIGLGVGWSVLVAAELIAATRGLGFMIQSARQFLETDVVIMGIIVIALPSLPAPTHARPASCASCTAPPTRCTCTRSRTSTWPSTRHSSAGGWSSWRTARSPARFERCRPLRSISPCGTTRKTTRSAQASTAPKSSSRPSAGTCFESFSSPSGRTR